MKRFSFIAILFGLCIGLVFYAMASPEYPELQDGDLIFQTSTSNQSSAILIATADPFTHMGIIKRKDEQSFVIEAAGTVRETPLEDWVKRGLLGRVAIYRDQHLTTEQASTIIQTAKSYYGRPYDIFFSFNNEAIYCSELPYLAYQKSGIFLGTVQKISELNFDNIVVKKLIKQRWKRHSECKGYDFEACFKHILNQDLITPASIAQDPRLTKIYSNYPL